MKFQKCKVQFWRVDENLPQEGPPEPDPLVLCSPPPSISSFHFEYHVDNPTLIFQSAVT